MKEGWYAIEDLNKEVTLHFVAKNSSISICKLYLNLPALKSRISIPDYPEEIVKCRKCEKIVPYHKKYGMNKTQLKESKTHPNIRKSFEKLYPSKINPSNQSQYFVTAKCSEETCNETGLIAFTFVKTFENKNHYCMKHNPRVQDTIRQTEILRKFEQEVILS